jgi:hypothetical protein
VSKSRELQLGNMERQDLVKFNEILDKLTVNKFFEYYSELRDYYQYLAAKYHFDLNSHTVDPVAGEIVPIGDKDKVYFDKMTN